MLICNKLFKKDKTMTHNNDTTIDKVKISVMQLLKGIGIALPIIITLICGYVNIMIKLTALEYGISENNKEHIEFKKELETIKNDETELKKLFNQHIIETDDTKVYKNYEKNN